MNTPTFWSRALVIVGLIAMLIGAIDPLEGSFVILPATALVALGALVAKSHRRSMLYWSLALVAVGVGVLLVLSWLGGVGGETGRSSWWLLVAAPYPAGWAMGLIGGVLVLVESFKHHAPPAQVAS
jgi:hypothetical protein